MAKGKFISKTCENEALNKRPRSLIRENAVNARCLLVYFVHLIVNFRKVAMYCHAPYGIVL